MKTSKCFILKSPNYIVSEMWSKLDYILLNANQIKHFNMDQSRTQKVILFIQFLPLLAYCPAFLFCHRNNEKFCSCLIIISLAYIFNQTCKLKARTHRDEYRRTLFASVFQLIFCVHTQAIFADDEPSEHANSFPDIRWRLM